MRAEFRWEPVYIALYFDADPTWFFRRRDLGEPSWAWPSAHYRDLLIDARRLVIAPPPKLRPLSADQFANTLGELRREIEHTEAPDPLVEGVWTACLEGLQKCERWIRRRT